MHPVWCIYTTNKYNHNEYLSFGYTCQPSVKHTQKHCSVIYQYYVIKVLCYVNQYAFIQLLVLCSVTYTVMYTTRKKHCIVQVTTTGIPGKRICKKICRLLAVCTFCLFVNNYILWFCRKGTYLRRGGIYSKIISNKKQYKLNTEKYKVFIGNLHITYGLTFVSVRKCITVPVWKIHS